MQIREKGARVFVFRSRYDPEKKRSTVDSLGSSERWRDTLPEEVRQGLSDEEKQQWAAHWAQRRSEEEAEDHERYVRLYTNQVRRALDLG